MAQRLRSPRQYGNDDENVDMYDDYPYGKGVNHTIFKGPSLETLTAICHQPPYVKDMQDMNDSNCIFMIKPFTYNPSDPDSKPVPINAQNKYIDQWDERHVRMPCSPSNVTRNGQPRWPLICNSLMTLKRKCDTRSANVEDLKRTIESCAERRYNVDCLEQLINEKYSHDQRSYFLSIVLSNICSLAMNVDMFCSRPPPLLRIDSNRSVTMSQQQAASLLACAFFCLFPCRSDSKVKKEYENFQNPNFNTLYQNGYEQKVEKLKCILHYFHRITAQMPNGVITFRRYALSNQFSPKWSASTKPLMPMHMTTAKKIEDVDCVLQVDFANKYIGGGVLTSGSVQEEIRFVICPEMLISLLVCEVMQPNECIYLIGCERYSTYKGYSRTFQFDGDYIDNKPKDNWGRKWCHLVAIDAVFFRDPSTQFNMKDIKRELIKAYAGFHVRSSDVNHAFAVATGNWGCGAFNGDRQLKAIIQLIAACEAVRPLIYAAYGDKKLVESFFNVYDYFLRERANVGHLYRYLKLYCDRPRQSSLFDFILRTPVSTLVGP